MHANYLCASCHIEGGHNSTKHVISKHATHRSQLSDCRGNELPPEKCGHSNSTMTYPDLCLHHRQHAHAGFSASQHEPSQLLPLQPEPSCGQSDKGREEVLQASSIALQLAAFHCHLAPPVQYAIAEGGFDGQIGHLACGPGHMQCILTGNHRDCSSMSSTGRQLFLSHKGWGLTW